MSKWRKFLKDVNNLQSNEPIFIDIEGKKEWKANGLLLNLICHSLLPLSFLSEDFGNLKPDRL